MVPQEVTRTIIEHASRLGFHRVGVRPVSEASRHDLYRAWLTAGYHGEMAYLGRDDHVKARRDVRHLLAEARSIVVVGLSYASSRFGRLGRIGGPESAPTKVPRGFVASYARGQDYHVVLKRKLTELGDALGAALGHPISARACVDTAPVLERDEAAAAGLGFIGKNTMLIAPGLGSFLVLGELLVAVDAAATVEVPERERCGDCRACLDACPTGAFPAAHVLDARKCIAYLTIEHKGEIPSEIRPRMGTMIFGCDVCQEVCPFNAASGAPPAPELTSHEEAHHPELIPLLGVGAHQFRRVVSGTALRRVRREHFLRNVCIALGNAGDPAALPALRRALEDRHPLVRTHAAWALEALGYVPAEPGNTQPPHMVPDSTGTHSPPGQSSGAEQ